MENCSSARAVLLFRYFVLLESGSQVIHLLGQSHRYAGEPPHRPF